MFPLQVRGEVGAPKKPLLWQLPPALYIQIFGCSYLKNLIILICVFISGLILRVSKLLAYNNSSASMSAGSFAATSNLWFQEVPPVAQTSSLPSEQARYTVTVSRAVCWSFPLTSKPIYISLLSIVGLLASPGGLVLSRQARRHQCPATPLEGGSQAP